jgi:hypothetical protein
MFGHNTHIMSAIHDIRRKTVFCFNYTFYVLSSQITDHAAICFKSIFNILYSNILLKGESNGKLPLRTCPGCSVPEPYRSPDWASS